MKTHILASFVVAYVLIAGIAILAIYSGTSSSASWVEFLEPVGIAIAALNTFYAAVYSGFNAKWQHQATKELEILKQTWGRDLEKLKTRYPLRINAYQDFYGAANKYYRALDSLERGAFDKKAVNDAEETAKAVDTKLVFLDPNHQGIWLKFWQEARNLNETASKVTTDAARSELWSKEIATFSKALKDFNDVVSPVLVEREDAVENHPGAAQSKQMTTSTTTA